MSDSAELQVIRNIAEANLYPSLIQQLDKDFSLVGLTGCFSNEILPENLIDSIKNLLLKIIQQHQATYTNLLYRIDVSEMALKKATHSNIEIMCERVALLVLKRECQKVWLRANY